MEEKSQRQWGLAAGIGRLSCGLAGVPAGTAARRHTDRVCYVCGLLCDQQDPETAASGRIGGGVVMEPCGWPPEISQSQQEGVQIQDQHISSVVARLGCVLVPRQPAGGQGCTPVHKVRPARS